MDQSVLSLGDMLTFLGLIIAVYQLAKPRYILLWRLSSVTLKLMAITLLVLGYFLPFVSLFTPRVENIHVFNAVLSLSQYLQVAGFLLITMGSLVVVYIYSRFNRSHLITITVKFKLRFLKYPQKSWRVFTIQVVREKNATTRSVKRFYEITSVYLVRGYIAEVTEVIGYNLKPLILSASQYKPISAHSSSDNKIKQQKLKGSTYAFELFLQLLTDRAAMQYICSSDYVFLRSIVWYERSMNDGCMQNAFAEILYPNLVEHLVLNEESFLYAQKDIYYGSARFSNVYKLIVADEIVGRQNIIPSLLTWRVSKKGIPYDMYVDVLAGLLERMVNCYKRQPSEVLLRNIHRTLDQMMGSSDGVTHRLSLDKKSRKRYADDVANSIEANVLRTLELNVVRNFFKDDDPDNFKNSQIELGAKNQESIYDHDTFTGLVSHKVYQLLEDITRLMTDTEDPDDSIRREFNNYLSLMHINTAVGNHYKELLYERMFDKAVYGRFERMTNLEGYYPNIMRPLIDVLVPFKAHLDDAEAQAQARMKRVMDSELKRALLNGDKMLNDEPIKDALLPKDVEVDIKKTTVKYYFINDKAQRVLIDTKSHS